MARTALTVQRLGSAGVEVNPPAANVDGHSIPLRDDVALLVRNDDTVDHTVTIPTPLTHDGLAVEDRTVTVATSTEWLIRPGADSVYRQDDGSVWIDFDDVTSVFCMLIQV